VTISDTGVVANDNDGTINGIDTINAAAQGSTVTFTDVMTKHRETARMPLTSPSPPTPSPRGRFFSLYKSDGVTPLIDTNGNSIPDTGPLAAGGELHRDCESGPCRRGPLVVLFNATATATSTVVGALNAGANAKHDGPVSGDHCQHGGLDQQRGNRRRGSPGRGPRSGSFRGCH